MSCDGRILAIFDMPNDNDIIIKIKITLFILIQILLFNVEKILRWNKAYWLILCIFNAVFDKTCDNFGPS